MANTYNTKNYFAHGGEQLVIGGKLTFLEGAEVENFPGGNTNSTEAPYVADSEATTVAALKTDFNGLLVALRTAGILSATAPETPAEETTDPETPAGGEDGGT
jgi:hypothetical protein